ncbi:cytochrome P450 [Pseudomonas putida]|uniref:cytochrome P450 n=1 Tax=Pseudomonas putida TaxID=303 RepID=UPI0022713D32|nr:cytochrome P450 [Pseudomonas putida]WAB99267.1 cytochrome P450 [Pseudomonas putida]
MSRCPFNHAAPAEFDLFSNFYLNDPAAVFTNARDVAPVFWYEPIGAWIITRRSDVDAALMDWELWSCKSNGAFIDIPAAYSSIVSPELMTEIMIGMDPPKHTGARRVAQKGFLKPTIAKLAPEIEARANRILDKLEPIGSAEFMEGYCLELTTQTLMALLALPEEDEGFIRQLRDDHFRVLASGREPIPEPEFSAVWQRYSSAQLHLRELVRARRDSKESDIISVMASSREADGSYSLPEERIAMHLTEFAAAGTDTTAQAMANGILFLSQHPEQLADVLEDPSLWPKVFEETVRRRPSAPFTSRVATRDTEVAGVTIKQGDFVWLALVSANTDPSDVADPMAFNIHREMLDEQSHYAFTKGRHTCLGAPLGRLQGTIGLRVAFERLKSLRVTPGQELDFLPLALLPIRRSIQVEWKP